MSLPRSWSEVYVRLAARLADDTSGREWVRQALEEQWGVADPLDLDRRSRAVALQKVSGVVLALEEIGYDVAFDPDVRQVLRRVFARYFGGRVVDGPPWRLSPSETDRPTYAEWSAEAIPF